MLLEKDLFLGFHILFPFTTFQLNTHHSLLIASQSESHPATKKWDIRIRNKTWKGKKEKKEEQKLKRRKKKKEGKKKGGKKKKLSPDSNLVH